MSTWHPRDIPEALGVPCLGWLPEVPSRALRPQSPLLERGAPLAFAEAVRGIRTAVVFASAMAGARSVMVTSAVQGEGKSVVSSNLSAALAQAGQRTLLIDADMRRPRVHDLFNCAQEPGLSNVLGGATGLSVAIRPTARPNLSVLPAGPVPSDPMALLNPIRARRLLERVASEYDWVVVDAPPVSPVTDAALLSGVVAGVIFVVGAGVIGRRPAQAAVEQLVAARTRVLGAVLNHVTPRAVTRYAHGERTDYTQG